MRFFTIKSRPRNEWGDYGDILEHGMTRNGGRIDGRLALKRTGTYISPITLPAWDVLLTTSAKNLLQSSSLTGFTFLSVERQLIVDLPWHTWSADAKEPAEYPVSGEPEDYILGQPHSTAASSAMGEIWELIVPYTVEIRRTPADLQEGKELRLDLSTWHGEDLVKGKEYGSILYSEAAESWFTKQWGDYVAFEPFPTL